MALLSLCQKRWASVSRQHTLVAVKSCCTTSCPGWTMWSWSISNRLHGGQMTVAVVKRMRSHTSAISWWSTAADGSEEKAGAPRKQQPWCSTISCSWLLRWSLIHISKSILHCVTRCYSLKWFYCFFQYGDEFAWSEIENVWTTLADSWPKNLKIILHFLISMSGVNSDPSLLPYVSKWTICFTYSIFGLAKCTTLSTPFFSACVSMPCALSSGKTGRGLLGQR